MLLILQKNYQDRSQIIFSDFTKPFHLYTDASDNQLGAMLVQDGKPLGFWQNFVSAIKLNPNIWTDCSKAKYVSSFWAVLELEITATAKKKSDNIVVFTSWEIT